MPKMTKEEKNFQARMDAETLAMANEIKSNPSRLKEAKQAAKSMAKGAQSRVNELKSISRQRTPKKNTRSKAQKINRNKSRYTENL